MSSVSLRSDSWRFDISGALTRPRPHNPHIPHYKTTQFFWWNIFPLKQAFSCCPSAPLCQTCAALLKCWIINVHKHFKRWRAIALKLARWSCVWWGYCFRQQGKVQTVFWASNLLMERNQMIKPLQSVFTPRTKTSGEHLRTLVIADLCEYSLQ